MYISKRLKELRTVSGFSQEKLAELLDVSRQTISSWENERSYPDVHNLIMLCDIYSVSLDDLATVYKGNIIKNLIMDCQSYTKYRPNETTGGIFVSWRRKEELPTGA